jgi:hypothetical protein
MALGRWARPSDAARFGDGTATCGRSAEPNWFFEIKVSKSDETCLHDKRSESSSG